MDYNLDTIHYCTVPRGKEVLVLTPHPDDEVLGCGGTILKHIDAQDHVKVVYLTNGQQNEPYEGCRKQEAEEVIRYMGVQENYFMGLEDTKIALNQQSLELVCEQICDKELIYVPHVTDGHPDHYHTTLLLALALKKKECVRNCKVLCYEIWNPLPANMIVNISNYISRKRESMSLYKCATSSLVKS